MPTITTVALINAVSSINAVAGSRLAPAED